MTLMIISGDDSDSTIRLRTFVRYVQFVDVVFSCAVSNVPSFSVDVSQQRLNDFLGRRKIIHDDKSAIYKKDDVLSLIG